MFSLLLSALIAWRLDGETSARGQRACKTPAAREGGGDAAPCIFPASFSPPAAGRNSGALPAGPAQGSAELVPG